MTMILNGRHGINLLWLAINILLSFISQSYQRIIINDAPPNWPPKSTTESDDDHIDIGARSWAVLVAGSSGFENYRHQADICHAYQILRKGGLEDENIIVFMYDDIAFNKYNPRPGTIINKPNGKDVYAGVPKDYTGHLCTVDNLYAVILGNKSALTGGSGKVVDSGPNDHIFIYYADHGSAGLLGMPYGEDLLARDLVQVLKRKHEAKAYKSMVFYLEACESGSIFDGLLPSHWNIYALTASNAMESSYGAYCPGEFPSPSSEYSTCLGDVFSISWMEDSDLHDMSKETLQQQYEVTRRRTGFDYTETSSHVMQYGNMELTKDLLSVYIGSNPENDNYSTIEHNSVPIPKVLTQRDATLLHFWAKFRSTPKGSNKKVEAHKKLLNVLSDIRHVDGRIALIAATLFGEENGADDVLRFVRPSGEPLVDDWDCLKKLVRVYEKQCGSLSWYGKRHTRALANMCNAGVSVEQMTAASTKACFMHHTTTTTTTTTTAPTSSTASSELPSSD